MGWVSSCFITSEVCNNVTYTNLCLLLYYTVKPLNKGHVGDNIITSLVLSFAERLSSSHAEVLNVLKLWEEQIIFGTSFFVERSIIHCPYLGGSTIGGPLYFSLNCTPRDLNCRKLYQLYHVQYCNSYYGIMLFTSCITKLRYETQVLASLPQDN